ncbi:MAG: N-acetylmannosaminyltransferase [Verrucomicrobiales bacterium]|nr:N-acetylmannosaminyltransferase [Verrucomicrobiales bacterium]
MTETATSLKKVLIGPILCSPHTIPQFVAEIRTLLADRALQPRTVACINAHVYNLAMQDPKLRQFLNGVRINTADGAAIVWAAQLCGGNIPERCNMTEAFRAFLENAAMPHTKAILVGSTDEECQAAARHISSMQKHCEIVATYSGFLDEAAYKNVFHQHCDADFILMGMSTPRTEYTAEWAASICPDAIVWVIGAGTIRIFAGTMIEAPVWMRRVGLQWLHRLFSDPRALWKRYIIGNPRFILHVLQARFARSTTKA